MSARTLSRRGYARHRRRLGLPGATLNAVLTAIAHGRIPTTANGRIDPVAADHAWAENRGPAKQQRPPLTRQRPEAAELHPAVESLYELRHVLGTVTTPLFRLVGAEVDVKAVFVEWMRIPDLLMQLEDSLRASGVPLLKDTP